MISIALWLTAWEQAYHEKYAMCFVSTTAAICFYIGALIKGIKEE
jgi:hypothetical protein